MNKKTIIAAIIVSVIALSPLSLAMTAKASTIDPASDEDHDGLAYAEEIKLGTNPDKWDTDGDGFADGVEVWNGYDPLKGNGVRIKMYDADNDGLTDEQEKNVYHSDPNKADSDKDGYVDGLETKYDYSPIAADGKKMADVDTDSDGLNDAQEVAYGTDLVAGDTDHDGYNDHCEVYSGHDPLSANGNKTSKYLAIAW